jgi:hypothetical protein
MQVTHHPPTLSSAAATIRARDAATSVRASVFEIAVATNSVKFSRRDSVSAGSDAPSGDVATMTPHSRPSTTIGAPTAERLPMPRT